MVQPLAKVHGSEKYYRQSPTSTKHQIKMCYYGKNNKVYFKRCFYAFVIFELHCESLSLFNGSSAVVSNTWSGRTFTEWTSVFMRLQPVPAKGNCFI